jgi:predicted carbohydrate-binding protein with CBM5 and CBM33 domain
MSGEIRESDAMSQSLERGLHNNLKLAAVCVLSGLVFIAFGVGFLILPAAHAHGSMRDNIAHALGHLHDHQAFAAPTPETVPTTIVWNEATIHESLNGDPARGEFIAVNCTACHGEHGVSLQKVDPDTRGC